MVSSCGVGKDGNSNQDAFSYTRFADGRILCMVCDGHGEHGEIVSERLTRVLPMQLWKRLENMRVDKALYRCFLDAQVDLEAGYRDHQVYSGSTMSVALIDPKLGSVWLAHCGDSTIALGDLSDGNVWIQTVEHKAHVPSELKRLNKSGAQVVQKKYPDGETMSRVFVPRTGVPGLAMSRSLGDGCLKKYGVLPDPEVQDVSEQWKKCKLPFICLASDGLWDTIGLEDAVSALANGRRSGCDIGLGAEVLCKVAQNLWIEAEKDYCDDVTIFVIGPKSSYDAEPKKPE